MTITVWQYNEVIDGLRMQLQLQRAMNQELIAENNKQRESYNNQANELYKFKEELAKVRTELQTLQHKKKSK